MASQTSNLDRVRVWVLIKIDGGEAEVLEKLKDLGTDLFYQNGGHEDYVIIRTDIIDHEYNVIAPIDAKDDAQYENARNHLLGVLGNPEYKELKTKAHHPEVPHESNAFVTYREDFISPFPEIKAGRIRKSPGANPWG